MKKILLLIFVLFSFSLSAQQTWEPMYLTVSGHHEVDGVEGWFSITDCGGTDVILIRFINTRSDAVKVTWYDAIFTQDHKWVYSPVQGPNMIKLAANEEVSGTCEGTVILKVEADEFGITPKDIFRFNASEIKITPQ